MDFPVSPIYAEINLDAFRFNFEGIKKLLSPETGIIAVVKADAYGHGAAKIAGEALKLGASFLAVARINEALDLRKEGIDAPILLFGDYSTDHTEIYAENRIMPSVNSTADAEEFSAKASSLNRTLQIHVKIDTGMGRLGMTGKASEIAEEIISIAELPAISAEGVYSHFAGADMKDKSSALGQLSLFREIRELVKGRLSHAPLFHIANSAAIMELPESHFDLVRPGIILYGLYPSDECEKTRLSLRPVMSLKSRITHIKKVPPGFPVSYGSTYVTDRESLIATVPAGYADGYSRLLSSKGEMLVRGKRAPITGRVCMDLTMIDVTEIPEAEQGDEVILIGSRGQESVTADKLAEKTGTINYEIVSALTSRVSRIYL